MAGSKIGGLKAKAKNLENNPNFYKEIGKIGGKKSRGGGFAAKTPCTYPLIEGDHIKPQCAGQKGGYGRIGYRKEASDVFQEFTPPVMPKVSKRRFALWSR